MSKINHLDNNLELEGKRVLLRVDFNVPINNGIITESSRIEKVLPTINFLIEKNAKIIIISHIGRPNGKIIANLTLKPIAEKLSKLINKNISFLKEPIELITIDKSKKISNGEIIMLENLRFNKEEELNEESFAKKLSKLGDIYVNEAFSCSHRAHASVSKITEYIKPFAGIELIKEVNSINMLTNAPKKPVTCIIGGSKISTKIGILNNLIKKMENIVIVGAMANNFIKHKGYNIGKSVFEKNAENLEDEIVKLAKLYNCNLVIPQDVLVAKNLNSKGKTKKLTEIDDSDLILDIGNKTIETISDIIDGSKTVLWNGPAGYFEIEEFSKGSKKIAKKIIENTNNKSLISVAGGGDTVAAINKFGHLKDFTYLSTAGGAFLELLEGKILPGIKALEIND